MKINFRPLAFAPDCSFKESMLDKDFELLFSWLQMPHVKKYWPANQGSSSDSDNEANYTLELVKEKYSDYARGHKKIDGKNKPINAFIIQNEDHPIGYIQYYNAYDFPRDGYELNNLPKSLAAIDMFIGNKEYLGKGIAHQSLELFMKNYVFKYFDYAFVDPYISNLRAIRCFDKSGFSSFKILKNKALMVASKRIMRISTLDAIAIEVSFRKYWLPNDSLWIFGSRVDLTKKGGDIDLYIETNATTIDQAFKMKQDFLIELVNNIGEQKIDIVLNMLHFPHHKDIHVVAKNEGIKII